MGETGENLNPLVFQSTGMSSQTLTTESSIHTKLQKARKKAWEDYKRLLINPRQAASATEMTGQQAAEADMQQPSMAGSSNHHETRVHPTLSRMAKSKEKRRENRKKQVEDFNRTFSENRDVLGLMVHAFQCELPQCQDPDCVKIKGMYRDGIQSHGIYCRSLASGGCDLCTKMRYFLRLHARKCRKEFCYVPHCSYLKDCTKMVQRLKTDPWQAGAMEMTRKRAAEAVPDTIHQNPVKSQKIRINIGRACKVNPSPSTPSLTASTSTSLTETVDGSHQFKITGYSLLKGMGIGKHIASDTFNVGGYEWAIYFYPDGKSPENNAAYVSCFIALVSEGTDVRALFELTLLDQTGKEMHKVHSHFGRIPDKGPYTLKYRGSMWGYKRLFRRNTLEASDYLKDDCLSFQCRVGVIKSHTEGLKISSSSVHPSDIGQHSGELSESGKGTDENQKPRPQEQAGEGVEDKMGHLSVADAVVDTMDEENVVVDKMGHLSIAEVVDTVDEHQYSVDDEWTFV